MQLVLSPQVVLESDDEEKAIIGQNIRMAFKNGELKFRLIQ